MKQIFRLTAIVFALLCATSCEKDVEQTGDALEPTVYNIAGHWQLASWLGEPLSGGLYSYISFDRKEKTFTLYQNLDSAQPKVTTGDFNIVVDADGVAVIRGRYDHTMGEGWSNAYEIVSLSATEMVWRVVGDYEDVSLYKRVDSIPAEVK